MPHPVDHTEIPFLVNPDNAQFLAGRGLAVPQRFGDGRFTLLIGAVLASAPILMLFLIGVLRINLGVAAILIIAAALGLTVYGVRSMLSGWRSIQLARAYRKNARHVDGVFTALELVDEGSGDWFLKGSYQFTDETGSIRQGTFAKYRYDLVGKPLPPVGTRAVLLVIDANQHAIL